MGEDETKTITIPDALLDYPHSILDYEINVARGGGTVVVVWPGGPDIVLKPGFTLTFKKKRGGWIEAVIKRK